VIQPHLERDLGGITDCPGHRVRGELHVGKRVDVFTLGPPLR
jgi:hypothetical protein